VVHLYPRKVSESRWVGPVPICSRAKVMSLRPVSFMHPAPWASVVTERGHEHVEKQEDPPLEAEGLAWLAADGMG
jgi:hypothetical protein